jgi:FtsZ-binding cell division protein ZapB
MVSLEQVKLLEAKVARAIDFVERVTGENAALREKLDSYQGRIDELEVLVQRFKEDQGRIEDGILSALDRLNQFEDAIEKSLAARGVSRDDAPAGEGGQSASPADEGPSGETGENSSAGDGEDGDPDTDIGAAEPVDSAGGETGDGAGNVEKPAENGELDIF